MQAKLGLWKLWLCKGESLAGRKKSSEVADSYCHRLAEGSRGSLLTRVCSESSLALCSSESNFSISRGRRNCREKHL